MNQLEFSFEQKFPNLVAQADVNQEDLTTIIQLGFKNSRYKCWIEYNPDYGYVVGINQEHIHFDAGKKEAWDYFEEIVNDHIAIVGLCDQEVDFVLGVFELEVALSCYLQEQPKVEIETFTKSH